jgi:ABC-type uncharacterized transport system permease subunit
MKADQHRSRRFRPGPATAIGAAAGLSAAIAFACDAPATAAVLSAALRQSTPLVLGALCGILCERAGVMNIAIEGQMLFAAFAGFITAAGTGHLPTAVAAAVMTGMAAGLVLAAMAVSLRIDQVVAGSVVNILALGLTGYFFEVGVASPGKLAAVALGPLAQIPLVGPALFDNPPITYAALVLVGGVHLFLFYTPWGLRLRAVGENPQAADAAGIDVVALRYGAVAAGGALAGLAGAFLTLEAVGSFERGMTNGRGFVAIAVMIFGKWKPLGAWGAAAVFGLAMAVQTQLQFGGWTQIPHQFLGMLPYLLTVVVLAGGMGRSRPPAALGKPYERD